MINLNNHDSAITETRERLALEETLETLQDALQASIFAAQPGRAHVVRGAFRPTEELLAARRRAEDEARLRERLEREKAKRRALRNRAGGAERVWSLAVEGSPHPNRSAAPLEDELPEEPARPGWRSRVVTFFQRKTIREHRMPQYDDVQLDGDADDGASFSLSMENGQRLSAGQWQEAESMFREYSCSKRAPGAAAPDAADGVEVIRSGFNRFGLKPAAAAPTAAAAPMWPVPEVYGSSPDREVCALPADSDGDGDGNCDCGPVRAGPEDEALLLRMLKDPRVKGLLQEFKEEAHGPGAPTMQSNTPQAVQPITASWGRRRQ